MNKLQIKKQMAEFKGKLTEILGDVAANEYIKKAIFMESTSNMVNKLKKEVLYEANEIEKLLATQLPKNTDFDGKSQLSTYIVLMNYVALDLPWNVEVEVNQLHEIDEKLSLNYDEDTKHNLIAHAHYEDFAKRNLKTQQKFLKNYEADFEPLKNLNPLAYACVTENAKLYFQLDKLDKQGMICEQIANRKK